MCFVQRYFGDDDDVLTPLLHGWLHQKMPAIFLHYHISLFTTSVLVHSSLSYWYNTHCIVCWEVIISDKQNLKLKWSCWRCWWEWIYSCSYVCVWLLTLAWPIDATLHHITTSHITHSHESIHNVVPIHIIDLWKINRKTTMENAKKDCTLCYYVMLCTWRKIRWRWWKPW